MKLKLNDYKPTIGFMVWDKLNNKMITQDKTDCIDKCLNYYENNIKTILLPYTNCKDMNDNKLYFGDVLAHKSWKNEKEIVESYKNNCWDMNVFIIIADEKTHFVLAHIEYTDLDEDDEIWKSLFNCVCKENDLVKLGSIYELLEIQKQFNIEV